MNISACLDHNNISAQSVADQKHCGNSTDPEAGSCGKHFDVFTTSRQKEKSPLELEMDKMEAENEYLLRQLEDAKQKNASDKFEIQKKCLLIT
ncbi:MAG: hypothetical protein FWG69_04205, partial [Oscillospiraceae bacterium]|nr:hypothetical protein [Oscillospiraceae bacterium]